MEEEPICVIELCKGYCCEHIHKKVKNNLEKLGLVFEPNGNGEFRCLFHDKKSGLCKNYKKRTWYCDWFFCDSAKMGFMRQAMKHIENPTTNKPLFR